jgi:hypothetical protein
MVQVYSARDTKLDRSVAPGIHDAFARDADRRAITGV